MGFRDGDSSTGSIAPWAMGAAPLLREVQEAVGFDTLALAVLNPGAPRVEGFVAAAEVPVEVLRGWCGKGFKEASLLRQARRQGSAEGHWAETPPAPLGRAEQVMVWMLSASSLRETYWFLAVGRDGEGFSEAQRQRAGLLLRILQTEFDHVDEPGMGRVLLGGDGELLHADPWTEGRFLRCPDALSELASQLEPVTRQRWPEMEDHVPHDLALELAGDPTWVRLVRRRALRGLERYHWYLELRMLSEGDIPPLGLIEDERIARAVGYISDRYAEAPSLAQIAEAVDISPFHFHRLFVRHTGVSPKHYLLRHQLMVAKWMLCTTRTPVGDVAAATGFASHGHFTATFHRTVGLSPTTYRERQ